MTQILHISIYSGVIFPQTVSVFYVIILLLVFARVPRQIRKLSFKLCYGLFLISVRLTAEIHPKI